MKRACQLNGLAGHVPHGAQGCRSTSNGSFAASRGSLWQVIAESGRGHLNFLDEGRVVGAGTVGAVPLLLGFDQKLEGVVGLRGNHAVAETGELFVHGDVGHDGHLKVTVMISTIGAKSSEES